MECQPCRKQDRNSPAEYRCTECEEALCYSCKSQHKSFKVSRNHNVIELQQASALLLDSQKEYVGVGHDAWIMCDEHRERSVEYFCIKHEMPCCILCKRQYHRHCCDVEKVDDVVDDSKLETITMNLLTAVEERKTCLNQVVDKERSNLRDLEMIKNNFIADLKNARLAIDRHLDVLQNNVEQEMIKKYETLMREINKRLTNFTQRKTNMTYRYKVIKETSLESALSLGQKYLKIMRLKHKEDGYSESHNTNLKYNLQSITNSRLSYVKTNDGINIRRIYQTLYAPTNGMDIFRGDTDKDGVESGSSTVELEPQAFNWKLSRPGTGVSTLPTWYTTKHSESSNTSPLEISSSSTVTQSTHLSYTFDSGNSSPFSFYIKNSFFIEKKNKNIEISDAKLMPNKYDIAIAETSNPRCMIYTKDGFKKGQLQLSSAPGNISVIEGHRIAVTLNNERQVNVINTDTWQLIKIFQFREECHGLVYFEKYLIANCGNEGLMYIDASGKLVKSNSDIKGELYLHLDNRGKLYAAKINVKRIHVYDLTNNKHYKYHVQGISDPSGLSTDRDNNLFVACNENDTIFVKHSPHASARSVLGRTDGIDGPWSIDYDEQNDELLVVNNNARSIFIFKKRFNN
ncbi:Hypothetical predicted protein [Mytilus galloprovincialis]|uniref:B box-type domain-containing protein n=1 Tax=Mytilus galloprovincialis TaxID=29158 RepID=A0A8B6DC53_MYTGA|nr:Hypothetical predicted protein [Mytilus galloprovincialis]